MLTGVSRRGAPLTTATQSKALIAYGQSVHVTFWRLRNDELSHSPHVRCCMRIAASRYLTGL
jgi:hypothetical protein